MLDWSWMNPLCWMLAWVTIGFYQNSRQYLVPIFDNFLNIGYHLFFPADRRGIRASTSIENDLHRQTSHDGRQHFSWRKCSRHTLGGWSLLGAWNIWPSVWICLDAPFCIRSGSWKPPNLPGKQEVDHFWPRLRNRIENWNVYQYGLAT